MNEAVWEMERWAGAKRIWFGSESGRQTRLFRRRFAARAGGEAPLAIFADFRFHLWVNGTYVGRGPIQRHADQLMVQVHEVGALLRDGENVVSVLVHTSEFSLHNGIPSSAPGLMVAMSHDGPDGPACLVTDGAWRVTERTGWSADAPRRGWAIDRTERFIAGEAPLGWQEPDFDDASWQLATVMSPLSEAIPGSVFRPNPLPALTYKAVAGKLTGLHAVHGEAFALSAESNSGDYGRALSAEEWSELPGACVSGSLPKGTLGLQVPEGATGVAVVADLGDEYVGQVIADFATSGPAVVDIGWAELSEDGRPVFCRKGMGYVDRLETDGGRLRWEPIQYTGARHLAMVVHTTGEVAVSLLGMRASEPKLEFGGDFACSDERLNAIWRMCERSLRVGTQEGLMDCPTREQACYVGDGHPCAKWLAMLTGDLRHWRYLVLEQFRRPYRNGLVRSTPFSGISNILLDYDLLAIIGARDYCVYAGDTEVANEVLPACRRILGWFQGHTDRNGLFNLDWRQMLGDCATEQRFDPAGPTEPVRYNLFIDHPGMGWHNKSEPGIDRRGLNAGINMLRVVAMRAIAELSDMAGEGADAVARRATADRLERLVAGRFWSNEAGCFVDGIMDGVKLSQLSEQTNAWALWAGCCSDAAARAVIEKVALGDHTEIAWCGPYFHTYLLPQMVRLGLVREALDLVRQRWGAMVDGGASTLWETFLGDDLDTWCHPWSAPPMEFLLTAVLGLPAGPGGMTLRPRYDLLPSASGTLVRPDGPVSIAWERTGDVVHLSGSLPGGVSAVVIGAGGVALGTVSGEWTLQSEA